MLLFVYFYFYFFLLAKEAIAFEPTTLLEGYDLKLNPYYKAKEVVIVNITIPFACLGQVKTDDQTATLLYMVHLEWTDVRLRFDPNHYDNETEIFLPSTTVWTPRYSILNAIDTKVLQNGVSSDVRISKNGVVSFTQIFYSTIFCGTRLEKFPFDRLVCFLQITKSRKNMTIVKLQALRDPTGTLDGNHEFQSKGYNISNLKPGVSNYIEAGFFFKFERNTFYYIFVIVLPAAFVTSLTVIGVLLPISSEDYGNPVGTGMTALLSLSITFSIIANDFPRSNVVPPIGWFVIICLGICLISVILGIAMEKMKKMTKRNFSVSCFTMFFSNKDAKSQISPKQLTTRLSIIFCFVMQGFLGINLLIFFSHDWRRGKFQFYDDLEDTYFFE